MDAFEKIAALILEKRGYWVQHSFKVNLTKPEKEAILKNTSPRPEIDLLAYSRRDNRLVLVEAKSFLRSSGVHYLDLNQQLEVSEGRYKLFTCRNYRKIVIDRLRVQLIESGMIDENTTIALGLIAGHVHGNDSEQITELFTTNGWDFWTPSMIVDTLRELAKSGYENNEITMTAQLLIP